MEISHYGRIGYISLVEILAYGRFVSNNLHV